jgi:hypothetical protein
MIPLPKTEDAHGALRNRSLHVLAVPASDGVSSAMTDSTWLALRAAEDFPSISFPAPRNCRGRVRGRKISAGKRSLQGDVVVPLVWVIAVFRREVDGSEEA